MNSAQRNFGLRYLGSLSGRGRLWAADELLGEAEYSIEVSEDASAERYAYGILRGSAEMLVRISRAQSEIQLECGCRPVVDRSVADIEDGRLFRARRSGRPGRDVLNSAGKFLP